MPQQKHVAIIDGYSSGQFLSQLFIDRGYLCIHIQSSPVIAADFKTYLSQGRYVKRLIFDGELATLQEKLSHYDIAAVIAGVDTGVALADTLSQILQLPGNDPKLSQARYNKYYMAEQLKAAGIKHIPHCRTHQWSDIVDFIKQSNTSAWVVKPLNSSGSDGVHVCNSMDQLKQSFQALMQGVDLLGQPYQEVLIQPYIEGEEYIVNTVSCGGEHYITDIWHEPLFISKDGRPLFSSIQLLPYDDGHATKMSEYIKLVLTALKIDYGAGHAEIMITDSGPVLIEIAARPMGLGISHILYEQALNRSQLRLAVDALVDSTLFTAHTQLPYVMRNTIWIVYLINPHSQAKFNQQTIDKINALQSCQLIKLNFELDDHVPKTCDLVSVPGEVVLIHNDPAQVKRDYLTLRQYESDLYSAVQNDFT